jgi:hypothetical protein
MGYGIKKGEGGFDMNLVTFLLEGVGVTSFPGACLEDFDRDDLRRRYAQAFEVKLPADVVVVIDSSLTRVFETINDLAGADYGQGDIKRVMVVPRKLFEAWQTRHGEE